MVGNGILSRLMPNLQVFFVMTPVQVFILLFILLMTLDTTIKLLLNEMEQLIKQF